MIKIHDCSNSIHRPPHRGGGGPLMNDIMRYLKEHAHEFDCEFVPTLDTADAVITNDVFTPEAEASTKPKIKRMDGIFQEPEYRDRQAILTRAATKANSVIFISEYAKATYEALHQDSPLTKSSVVLNVADPTVFLRKQLYGPYRHTPKRFVAVATDWNRPEKNLTDLLSLAQQVPHLAIVGTPPDKIIEMNNVSYVGYLTEKEIATELECSDAMLCTSINDPAPKTVAQAIAVGIPIVYHNSGGLPELVRGKFGMRVDEFSLNRFTAAYKFYCNNYKNYDPVEDFNSMLEKYFNVIKKEITTLG